MSISDCELCNIQIRNIQCFKHKAADTKHTSANRNNSGASWARFFLETIFALLPSSAVFMRGTKRGKICVEMNIH